MFKIVEISEVEAVSSNGENKVQVMVLRVTEVK